MNNIVEAVFGTCNPYECATRILYRYDYGMILTFPDLELPTAYEVHFSNYDDVGTTITQIGNEDGVSIPDEFLQTGLPVYCWVYLHTGEDDGETVYKVTINVQDRPQPSNGTPTPVQQDAITEAIAALDSAVEQTGADASSANADALKSEGYAVGTQDGEPVEQGSPYYRHNSLWLSQQAGQSANKAEAQASLSEAWAVGEISGHPVSSDYPQYENNSKYYAEQASHSADDAEESAQSVLGLTADATVDSNVGTPSVSVSVTTESDHKKMSFAFRNLKGVQGDTGVGISSVVLNADYTLTITLTNGTSYTTSSIRGEVGATPNLTIGTVATLPEGSQATATITGTSENPVLNLGIPVGYTGVGIASVEKTGTSGLVDTYTITYTDGTTSTFEVTNGADGEVSEEELETALIDKADVITSSASGEIVTIQDGGDDLPVKELVVGIEPVQDLHGYDSPWPAGGGKNILDPSKMESYSGGYGRRWGYGLTEGITLKANQSYTFSVSGSSQLIRLYILDKENGTVLSDANTSTTYTPTADIVVYLQAYRSEVIQDSNNFQLEVGSSASSYVPYSNVCPISGWTGVEVTQKSKNLIGGIDVANRIKDKFGANATIDTTAKTVTFSPTSGQGYPSLLYNLTSESQTVPFPHYYPFKENTRYTFIFKATSTESKFNMGVSYTDGTNNGGFSPSNYVGGNYVVWTSPANKTVLSFYVGTYAGITTLYYDTVGVFEGVVTLDDFTPYEGNYYPISWQSSAGTVYGGSLDVTSGVLSVDCVLEVLDTLIDGKINSALQYANGFGTMTDCVRMDFTARVDVDISVYNRISSTYPSKYQKCSMARHYFAYASDTVHWYRNTQMYVYLPKSFGSSITEVSQTLYTMAQNGNPLTIIMPYKNPVQYQLTPEQIATFLGTNNFWSNSNGQIDLEYRADTKLYIQQLTKPSEDDMVANANITSGSFFMVGNRLFLSTTAIAQGEQIVVGTNCTEVSLADALNQINA